MRVSLRAEPEIRAACQEAFDLHRGRVQALLPEAVIEHMGATAVPGAVTKGDVDLLARVPAASFERSAAALGSAYSIHQPENWTSTFASFTDLDAQDPPVGVQLVVTGSDDDRLLRGFRDALIADPGLLGEYNAVKRAHEGEEEGLYRKAKEEFIERRFRGAG